MKPAALDLAESREIYQGDDYSLQLYFFDVDEVTGLDLTDYTAAKAQVRQQASSTTAMAEFTCTIAADQTTNPGLVTITLTGDQTMAMSPGTWVWDFEMVDGDSLKHTWVAGGAVVIAQVTRA